MDDKLQVKIMKITFLKKLYAYGIYSIIHAQIKYYKNKHLYIHNFVAILVITYIVTIYIRSLQQNR